MAIERLSPPSLLIPCILPSENRAARRAVVGGMAMSKPVSNSVCCHGAAAQSKRLSVGHLDSYEQQQQRLTAPQCSPKAAGGKAFQLFTSSYAITLLYLPSCKSKKQRCDI